MRGGHAAFLGFEVVVGPHYLRDVPVRHITDEGTYLFVHENLQNGTILPLVSGGVFKGAVATEVLVDVTYAQFNDTTINAPIEHQNGFLIGTLNYLYGDMPNTVEAFEAADNSVSMNFNLKRAPTYLSVMVLQTGTFLVVLGSIFAYVNTLRNALELVGKALEWAMFSCCKKQRTRTHTFFMRPYEGQELREMMGFKEYNDDSTAVKAMKRNEVRLG